ncbi:teichoic acids export ATP-binding protein TagH [Abditibacteriota bacterium]|nr:teichoic acids export ATP-binding protein TagH [Abditibacteriota bacterium]
MSSKDIAVSVRGLSKAYTIAHNAPKHTMVGEALMHRLKHPFQRAEKETFWALKDVEFDIQKGDVVGIIGRNGAGKSTLLKILSRITKPTTGQIDLYGRVGSLLEVGTGFHPELTGRENIFLNGAILGMRKREIERQFDAIVDFAGVEQFLDTPVKRYSSGMYVRLAFAVAAHLSPYILIIDEVLAVGDIEFQKKCLGKIGDVAKGGRTVLFVSHNMQTVNQMCSSAILFKSGRIEMQGGTKECVSQYLKLSKKEETQSKVFAPHDEVICLLDISLSQGGQTAEFLTSHPIDITASVVSKGLSVEELICGFILYDEINNEILSTFFNDMGDCEEPRHFNGTYKFSCSIPANILNEGKYRLIFDVGIAKKQRVTSDDTHFLEFTIKNIDGVASRFGLGTVWRSSPVLPLWDWNSSQQDAR